MPRHLRYAVYLARHKWFVLVAGLRTGAPLWRLIVHDWSKLTPAEWGGYVAAFFSGRPRSETRDAFELAWNHHVHRNPHHWEHWQSVSRGGALRMPDHFVREMVADWAGAGRGITGRWDVARWYEDHRSEMLLHERTRELAEELLRRHFGLASGGGGWENRWRVVEPDREEGGRR